MVPRCRRLQSKAVIESQVISLPQHLKPPPRPCFLSHTCSVLTCHFVLCTFAQ